MDFEKSCGAVIYRMIDGNLEFLTISHRNDGHWGFPKGHMEENECEEETAVREVSEETGLLVTIINGFRESVDYLIKQETRKEVVYFLAQVQSQIVHIQVEEVADYKWSSFQQTKQLLSYKSSKEVLEKACQFIVETVKKSNEKK
ncbi:bis(5'-nucleosyl)-tetraphosphatase [Clostridium tagluense]|uniref:Bis(5'-nucleosyl)-tetraphosphatase [asymmetrical] n=1 Tax=Clostridium tagluense TaxID=360422 RepID=A0A401UK66_9CLOT|nr:NUDIX domain-containing protein [Clostridium tagluense]GCD09895.1 NUDIX hydrolase [Clostridium tagluense]